MGQLSHVVVDRDAGVVAREDAPGGFVVLAHEAGWCAGSLEGEVDSTDAGEQGCDLECHVSPTVLG